MSSHFPVSWVYNCLSHHLFSPPSAISPFPLSLPLSFSPLNFFPVSFLFSVFLRLPFFSSLSKCLSPSFQISTQSFIPLPSFPFLVILSFFSFYPYLSIHPSIFFLLLISLILYCFLSLPFQNPPLSIDLYLFRVSLSPSTFSSLFPSPFFPV